MEGGCAKVAYAQSQAFTWGAMGARPPPFWFFKERAPPSFEVGVTQHFGRRRRRRLKAGGFVIRKLKFVNTKCILKKYRLRQGTYLRGVFTFHFRKNFRKWTFVRPNFFDIFQKKNLILQALFKFFELSKANRLLFAQIFVDIFQKKS